MLYSRYSSGQSRAFTLVEMLLYLGLSAIILVVVSSFLAVVLTARAKSQTVNEVETQASFVMRYITQAIRNADTIITPTTGNAGAAVTLGMVQAPIHPTTFSLTGSALSVTEGTGSPVALTNSRVVVSGLSFANVSRSGTPGIIRVQFTLSHVNADTRQEYAFTKNYYGSASLRHP